MFTETRTDDGKLRVVFFDGRILTFSIRAEKLIKELCELKGINWNEFIKVCHQLMDVLKIEHMFIVRRHGDIALFTHAILDTMISIHSPRKRRYSQPSPS